MALIMSSGRIVIYMFSVIAVYFCASWIFSELISPLFAYNGNHLENAQKVFLAIVTIFAVVSFGGLAKMIYRVEPIKRDRFLFAHSGWGMAIYSTIAIFLILLFIGVIAYIWDVPSEDVYGKGPDSYEDKLIWHILGQFADPGNLPQSKGVGGSTVALLSAFAGILCLSGLVVSSLVSMISRRTQQWKAGLIRYKYGFKDYVVIVGSNEQTATIVKNTLRNPDVKYVLIQTRKNVEKERSRLELRLEREDEERVVFYYGDRALEEDIQDLHLEKAREVYILGEDMHNENEDDHDAFNMSCLEHISQYMQEHPRIIDKKNNLRCHVNFEYQSTFTAFKATHIYRSLNSNKIEFLPFNVHEIWAKKVLVDNTAVIPTGKHAEKLVQRYLPLDAYWMKTEDKDGRSLRYIDEYSERTVHLVVVGMNQMGVAMAIQAALLVHLPNFQKDNNLRTTITFIDNNAVKEGEFLMGRYAALFALCKHRTIVCGRESFSPTDCLKKDNNDPYNIMWKRQDGEKLDWTDPMEDEKGRFHHLGRNFMDLQWEFVEGNIASRDIQNYLSVLSEDTDHRTCTIAVCFNNPQQSIATALYLPEIILKRALQILVYQQNTFDMINKVATSEREWKRYEKLEPFGMIEGCYSGDVFDNMLAKFANLVYNDNKGELDEVTEISDTRIFRAERLWKELGIVYKLANINLADSFAMKLRSIRKDDGTIPYLRKNDERLKYLAWAEHNRWLTERLTMGYRPMDKKELQEIIDKHSIHDKEYYKNKSRAHVDICSNSDLEKWDKATYDRKTDWKIISLITTIIKWEQQSHLRNIYTGKFSDETVCEFVKDMCEVSGNSGKFWMGKHCVTKKQWFDIMGWLPGGNEKNKDNEPVVHVSKEDVNEFLLVLNSISKLQFRLPVKEEWDDAYICSKQVGLEDMEGLVWQWTDTKYEGFNSGYYFCGKSKDFLNGDWKGHNSYWLPNFESSDLGFRLVLPYEFSQKDINSPQPDYRIADDDIHVIEELVQSMVRVKKENDTQSDFFMLPNPVTQRQWKAVMREGNQDVKNPSEHRGDYYPVECVSFEDVEIFIKKLNSKNRQGIVFRLPNYEEWLRAARFTKADKMKIWHSGITKSTHRVITMLEQDKIYNLYGNVWEWCANGSNGEEPLPPNSPSIVRMLMGGSWRFTESECKSQEGSYWTPQYKSDDVGFRIVADKLG